jgi:hypothetical protein
MIPLPQNAFASDGNLKVIVVTVVPSTAIRLGGLAFHVDGSLYVVIV